MTRHLAAAVALLIGASAGLQAEERALHLKLGDPARRERELSLVVDGIRDTARGDLVTPDELAARLDGVSLLFVGESHTDFEFHRVERRVIQELQRRGRPVLVGLEMYPATAEAQQWLDRWSEDRGLDEQSFVDQSHWYRSWGYNWRYYRDIFLDARESGTRLYGVNVPRAVVQTVRLKGEDALTPAERALLPARVDTASAEHQQLFRAFFGEADSLHGNMPEAMFQAMYRAQCTWDAAMGWNALRALRDHGADKAIVVVLIGSGHVAYGLGAERQARLWFTGRTASLVPVSVREEGEPPVAAVQASYADFVWGLPPTTEPIYPSVGISTPEQKTGERFKVIAVAKDSPAAAAGFELGDELVSIDGEPCSDKETMNRVVAGKRWGDVVVYELVRGATPLTLTVSLRRRTPTPTPEKAAEAGRSAAVGG
jgi:aminopeptidase N